MTNKERLQKLEQVVSILREVKDSYPDTSNPHRRMIYQVLMVDFTGAGSIAGVMKMLKKFITSEEKQRNESA